MVSEDTTPGFETTPKLRKELTMVEEENKPTPSDEPIIMPMESPSSRDFQNAQNES